MTESGQGVLIVVCISNEDEPDEQLFARTVVGEFAKQAPGFTLLLPDEGRTAIWDDLDRVNILGCRYIALSLGGICDAIIRYTQQSGINKVLLLGPASEFLSEYLTKNGLTVATLSSSSAMMDSSAPVLKIETEALQIDSARQALEIPEGHFVVLVPAASGMPAALDLIDEMALSPPSEDPQMLIFSDQWHAKERLIQRARLKALRCAINFCGEVPLTHRAMLIAASDAVVSPAKIGAFEGHDAALANHFGRQIIRPGARGTEAHAKLKESVATDWHSYVKRIWERQGGVNTTAPTTPEVRSSSSVLVIMPTFECQPYLRRAIASVQEQNYADKHLVVVDDSGRDVDDDLIRDFPDVTFLRSCGRVGPYAIANTVAAATKSDFLAFHDADDESSPERLAAQLECLFKYKFDAVGTNSRVVDLSGALIGVEVRPVDATMRMREDATDTILHPTSLMYRSLFDNLGGFDSNTRFGADTEFHFRAALAYDIGNLDQFLYMRLQRPESLTQNLETGFGSDARVKYNAKIIKAFRDRIAEGRYQSERMQTLYNEPIPVPNFADFSLLGAGRDASRWLSAALGG